MGGREREGGRETTGNGEEETADKTMAPPFISPFEKENFEADNGVLPRRICGRTETRERM